MNLISVALFIIIFSFCIYYHINIIHINITKIETNIRIEYKNKYNIEY